MRGSATKDQKQKISKGSGHPKKDKKGSAKGSGHPSTAIRIRKRIRKEKDQDTHQYRLEIGAFMSDIAPSP